MVHPNSSSKKCYPFDCRTCQPARRHRISAQDILAMFLNLHLFSNLYCQICESLREKNEIAELTIAYKSSKLKCDWYRWQMKRSLRSSDLLNKIRFDFTEEIRRGQSFTSSLNASVSLRMLVFVWHRSRALCYFDDLYDYDLYD